jgi:diguanylate cyclase (GGDEF)-like protein/PAS domain S-box-containing protein
VHTVSELFNLSKDEAGTGDPVELDVVVTYSDPEWGLLFVQDPTGVTFVDMHGSRISYPLGARVHLSAVSAASASGPRLEHPKITVLGRGAFPRPLQQSVPQLDAGEAESHWVATEGVLHPCNVNWTRVCFRLVDAGRQVWLAVRDADTQTSQSMIGARVRVRGVVGQHKDDADKRIGAQLFVNSLKEIEVVESPQPGIDPMAIRDLSAPNAGDRAPRLKHVRGTVIWQSPDLFFIHDSTGSTFVGTVKPTGVHTGENVDVIGFPSRGEFGLELADSSVSILSGGASSQANAPLGVTAAEVLSSTLNGRRVHLHAHVVAQRATPGEFVYTLEDGGQRFSAVLLRSDTTREIVGISRGSVLDLTGVALIPSGSGAGPDGFIVLVESPADIAVQGGYPWFTVHRALAASGFALLCILAPLIWVKQLRATVRKQTAVHRRQMESEFQLASKFQRLFERNLAAVFTWKADGTIVECNDAFVRLLGFNLRDQLIGRSFWDFEAEPLLKALLCRGPLDEALSNRETCLRRDDGGLVHLLANIIPVQTVEGVLYETTAIDVTQLRQHQIELQRAKDAAVRDSLVDLLTGLPNRRHLLEALSARIAAAARDGSMVGLLYLDLDGFKLVNDSLGHAIGDELLVQVANSLAFWIPESDVLARLGGDEFMVIMNSLRRKEDASELAANLLGAVAKTFHVRGHELAIGVSIGISIFPDDGTGAEELMQEADGAMYAAKRDGRNRIMHFTSEIGAQAHERLTLENLLRGAIARCEISVHYQPEYELADHRLTRFEALARWTHPILGEIPPCKFIPIAEESGMIAALGAYIMERACAEAVKWQGLTPDPIQIAVNVSSIQFRHKGFVKEVSAILQRTGLKPGLLQLELTESVMLGGVEQAAATIDRLREIGVSMAVDDFGTGYSNMSYLPSLAFDTLKIDRSFVINMDTQPERESMIRTLISLARNFGMRVIVEGVEKPEQLALVKSFGANEVQGFLLGRPCADPMPAIRAESAR